MNGENNLPSWLNLGLLVKLATILLGLGVMWGVLSAKVDATDLIAKGNTTAIATTEASLQLELSEHEAEMEKQQEQITVVRETQVRVVTVLDAIQSTLKEIKNDLKEHRNNGE